MTKFNESFDYIKINLASPERIKQWACHTLRDDPTAGEVTKSETINYRTFKPEMGGLFCEKIFGPVKSWECHCGKYKRIRQQVLICERCGVEVTESRVRRHRMGYIQLEYPVAHIWYVRGFPSYLSLLLGIKRRELKEIIYFNEINFRQFDNKLLNWAKNVYGNQKPRAGAELIFDLLSSLDLEKVVEECRTAYRTASASDKEKIIKRVRILENFIATKSNPTWMLLSVIPVLPPGLRPMVQLEGGRFATSDLNELYRRVINRNNRLKRFFAIYAPEIIIRNEKRMLQEAVDALIDNGHREKKAVGLNNRPLKSLSDILSGKQGRFRQNLLGKRVDYSGRSVIVVGPELKLNQCGLPYEIACELFQPFLIHRLIQLGYAGNMKIAKRLIQEKDIRIWEGLQNVLDGFPIFLNRAPTLHRLGIQAFEPIIVDGRAIKLHPLVCPAFNADFDGDQMAIHVPLSIDAQAESYLLMLGPNNFMSPATGEPILLPSQDMVLGSHYLTSQNRPSAKGNHHYFANMDSVLQAYNCDKIALHSSIWLKFLGQIQTSTKPVLLETTPLNDGSVLFTYTDRQIRKKAGEILVTYILTTPGRVLFNNLLNSVVA
ncbi:DNA-directed RNA polymerase subunit beta (chloroplast) [Aureococcus anophagefferens]|jgi:DNA-directed RNA polymerase subunit beta'|uniref:DNA-directed RNA polymerase subunit beta n=2 Tax=Aureococcus anophagefferens TaxID=44056 RepID=A0ABR1G554_AURAN|nr:DNA-directed RNA polymerase beta' chain [Aureococcus anophagefferens]ACS36794.1 DNA-directed RNA polymerase beta' chain [Aureococcus anophagefferens]KAH8042965.1 DNA-directed RNA polymerase subunit beta' [Aureococcus anophagefferens]KAH8043064.1 DNA-directed RNA polymerase subunit beta' [Aureococcus anophagefferens]KAH8043267.1 DNA-directed RNA polymerase subunit beta' [Aureococcus anophagefferens]|tara:strand:- start:9135 stop:10943 length:1809 start_codon:yes stop_codon:yes gene_type:complete